MNISDEKLIKYAQETTKKARIVAEGRKDWKFMGYVGAALVTVKGNVFTGINLSLFCGMGFCAEHSAVAEMVKNGETKIDIIVAVTAEGSVVPPCGKCREMLYQIDESNLNTQVIVCKNEKMSLHKLLPYNWQEYFDQPLI